jgi:hypothetical protein
MAFSHSENNWVTSTCARKPKDPERGDGHTCVSSRQGGKRGGLIGRRIEPPGNTPDSRGQGRSATETATFSIMFCRACASAPDLSTALSRASGLRATGLPRVHHLISSRPKGRQRNTTPGHKSARIALKRQDFRTTSFSTRTDADAGGRPACPSRFRGKPIAG